MYKITLAGAACAYTQGLHRRTDYSVNGGSVNSAIAQLIGEGGSLLLAREARGGIAVVVRADGEMIAIGGDALGRNARAVVISVREDK